MLVAIRKRSWEEHVTHPSGLQYSYDDLDLVCSHGVDGDGLWMGSGAFKQGRRTRCASMPEGCHQLPTDDPSQTLVKTPSADKDVTESEHLRLTENNGNASQDFQESVHSSQDLVGADIPQNTSASEHLQTADVENSGVFCCNSNRSVSSLDISCTAVISSQTESAQHFESGGDTESSQSRNGTDDHFSKSPHICHEGQQYISISSNNGSLLSECARELSGKPPNHHETMESHAEGYSRPPVISEAMLNQSSVVELEPQTVSPDVVEGMISTSDQAGVSGSVPVLHSSANVTDDGNAMAMASRTTEPVVTLAADGECEKGITKSWRADSAHGLDGLNDSEPLNNNTGFNHHSRDIQGEKDPDDCAGVLGHGCEIFCQTLLEQHDVESAAGNLPQEDESARGGSSGDAAHVRHELSESPDTGVKNQCCFLTANQNVSSEQAKTGYSQGDPNQTNTLQCADQSKQTSLNQSMEDSDQSVLYNELSTCEDITMLNPSENSGSKLDTIPEISFAEANNATLITPQKKSDVDVPQNPVLLCHLNDKHEATEEVSNGLHSNQTSDCHFSESPASEVADGQREHYRPGTTISVMEESDQAAHSASYSDAQLSSSVFNGIKEPGEQKEEKVRMRKVSLKYNRCINHTH